MKETLQLLRELAQRDAAIARGGARRNALEVSLERQRELIRAAEGAAQAAERSFRELEASTTRQSNALRDERTALEERRNSLATLMAPKLQEAALREISTTELSLDERELQVLTLLEQVERLQKVAHELQQNRDKVQSAGLAQAADARAEFEVISQRELQLREERTAMASQCPAPILQQYDRAKLKYPTDPIAAIDNHHCSGCRMQIGAQIGLQVLKVGEGDLKVLVRCPGCSRLLFP